MLGKTLKWFQCDPCNDYLNNLDTCNQCYADATRVGGGLIFWYFNRVCFFRIYLNQQKQFQVNFKDIIITHINSWKKLLFWEKKLWYHLKLGLLFCLFCDVSLGVIKVSENPLVIICFVISFVSSLYLTHVTCATWCCSLLGATGFDTKLFVTISRIVTTFLLSSQLSSQFLSSSRISQSSLLRWSDIFGGWRKK